MHRDRAANLKTSLEGWNERLSALKENADVLHPEVHLAVIRELQTTFDRCGIILISENLVPAPKDESGPLRTFTHSYEIRGSFRQLQAVLLLVEEMPWRMELHDLILKPCDEMSAVLQLTFTLNIYYLAE